MSTKLTMPAAHVRPDEGSAPTAARSQVRRGRRQGRGWWLGNNPGSASRPQVDRRSGAR